MVAKHSAWGCPSDNSCWSIKLSSLGLPVILGCLRHPGSLPVCIMCCHGYQLPSCMLCRCVSEHYTTFEEMSTVFHASKDWSLLSTVCNRKQVRVYMLLKNITIEDNPTKETQGRQKCPQESVLCWNWSSMVIICTKSRGVGYSTGTIENTKVYVLGG